MIMVTVRNSHDVATPHELRLCDQYSVPRIPPRDFRSPRVTALKTYLLIHTLPLGVSDVTTSLSTSLRWFFAIASQT